MSEVSVRYMIDDVPAAVRGQVLKVLQKFSSA